MGSRLHVMGLGPAGLEKITLGDYQLLQAAKRIFVRTKEHPAVKELIAQGFTLESFDGIYDNSSSFESVYEQIVACLAEELDQWGEVVYAVPGHPMVAEKSVQLILDKLSERHQVIIRSANSFLDEIFTAIGFDPIEGLLVRNYDELDSASLSGREWMIIPQVYSRLIASEVKLNLMAVYPDEMEVYLVSALGTGKDNVSKVVLFELDHQAFNHLSTVVVPPCPDLPSWVRLKEVISILRSPEGCPWDREQTHESLKPFLVEESYEVLEAIDNQDMYNLCEELGDLLLQIILHAQIAAEEQEFELHDVVQGIIAKMIRRHPHVFGTASIHNSAEVLQAWDELKKAEKEEGAEKSNLFKASPGLPALMLAEKTQEKVAKVGFDWPDLRGPLDKVKEELGELERALSQGVGIGEEFGDLLFSLVNLARFLKLDAEDSLRQAVRKFQTRFLEMERLALLAGRELGVMNLEEMDNFWDQAKLLEKNRQ